LDNIDFTVTEVRGFALAGTENTGKPDLLLAALPEANDRPLRAQSEITAPAEDLLASATSFAAARIVSSISRVVLIADS